MEPAWAWRVLGVTPGSPAADVRRAFRRAAQLLHPDRVADLPPDVRDEAHRRMVELGEAYRVCSALAAGLPPPPPRAHDSAARPAGGLTTVGGRATELLDAARRELARVAPVDAYRANRPTLLDRSANASASRRVVTLLEQVADAWPGTAEGDAARLLLVTSTAAGNALSPRERAGHLALVVDPAARTGAWDSLHGRDEVAIAQVVYAHPTAPDDLRRAAKQRLAEMGDWATLADDAEADVRQSARAHLLLRDGRLLAERARWLSGRERPAFDADHEAWRSRLAAGGAYPPHLAHQLDEVAGSIESARAGARA